MTVPRWLVVLAAGFSAVLALAALFRVPTAHGDSGEYFLVAEALANHGTPAIRPDDIEAIGRQAQEHTLRGGFGAVMSELRRSNSGDVYTLHFWLYPLTTVPIKLILRVLGGNEFAAPQITNTLMLLGATWCVLAGRWPRPQTRWAALLGLFGPPAWFCVWPHPEVFSYSLALLGLALAQADRLRPGAACLALASTQNPPLALAALAMPLLAVWRGDRRRPSSRDIVQWTASLSPVFLPAAFYVWHFGRPTLLAPEAVAVSNASVQKAGELLLDLNIGLLPFTPGMVLAALAAPLVCWRTERRLVLLLWALFLAVAYACTTTANWNHGTSGPSRYGVWLIPLLALCAGLVAGVTVGRVTLTVAIFAQLIVLASRAGTWGEDDHERHSTLARATMVRVPSAYNPSPELFQGRTPEAAPGGAYLFRTDRCHKALAQKRHAALLQSVCGVDPPGYAARRHQIASDDRGRDAWMYVDY